MRIKILYISLLILFTACNEYTPRPRGYQRVEREQIDYVKLDASDFSFLYPTDAHIEYVKSEAKPEIWFNILYPQYNATIYCTYIPLHKQNLSQILDDSYQLAYSHTSKAESISQSLYTDSIRHMSGLIYDIQGTVASPVQFYITDKSSNYLRGSLYFSDLAKADSIAPVVDFLRSDIVRIMETLEWTKKQ